MRFESPHFTLLLIVFDSFLTYYFMLSKGEMMADRSEAGKKMSLGRAVRASVRLVGKAVGIVKKTQPQQDEQFTYDDVEPGTFSRGAASASGRKRKSTGGGGSHAKRQSTRLEKDDEEEADGAMPALQRQDMPGLSMMEGSDASGIKTAVERVRSSCRTRRPPVQYSPQTGSSRAPPRPSATTPEEPQPADEHTIHRPQACRPPSIAPQHGWLMDVSGEQPPPSSSNVPTSSELAAATALRSLSSPANGRAIDDELVNAEQKRGSPPAIVSPERDVKPVVIVLDEEEEEEQVSAGGELANASAPPAQLDREFIRLTDQEMMLLMRQADLARQLEEVQTSLALVTTEKTHVFQQRYAHGESRV